VRVARPRRRTPVPHFQDLRPMNTFSPAIDDLAIAFPTFRSPPPISFVCFSESVHPPHRPTAGCEGEVYLLTGNVSVRRAGRRGAP